MRHNGVILLHPGSRVGTHLQAVTGIISGGKDNRFTCTETKAATGLHIPHHQAGDPFFVPFQLFRLAGEEHLDARIVDAVIRGLLEHGRVAFSTRMTDAPSSAAERAAHRPEVSALLLAELVLLVPPVQFNHP